MGISRYYSSTNTPPNKPYTLQNLYSPRRGELAIIPGVSELTNTIPNCTSIDDITYLDQSMGDQGWLVSYSITTPPTGVPPTSFTFASPTSTPSASTSVVIEFVYSGGTTTLTTITGVAFKTEVAAPTSGNTTYCDVTLPTSAADIPSSVFSINYYVLDVNGLYGLWAGAHMRKSGIFPPSSSSEATIRLYMPLTTSPTSSCISVGDVSPSSMTATPTTVSGGELTAGRTYYFGICPYLSTGPSLYRQNKVQLYPSTSSAGRFAAYLPSGYNAFSVSFGGVPTSTGLTSLTGSATEPVRYYQFFAGKTPEAMAPVGTNLVYQSRPQLLTGSSGTVVLKSLPYNTNQAMSMAGYSAAPGPLGTCVSRTRGTWAYINAIADFPRAKSNTKGLAHIQFPYSISSHKEQLPGVQFTFTVGNQSSSLTSKETVNAGLDPYFFNYGFNFMGGTTLRSQVYQDLAFYVNGYANPYQSNGDLVAPVAGDDTSRLLPITTNIDLYNDRLILGCGQSNWTYDQGLVFYSNAAVPTDLASGTGNFLNVNFGDNSDMVGFGSFSKDLASAGPTAYLLVGKKNSCYIWNGGTTASDQQLVQVGKQLGWLSVNSFGLTKNGPVVVTKQGLFSVDGSDMTDLDPGTGTIFSEMDPANYPFINVVYSDDRLIVGYSTDGLKTNRELWYDFRDEPDGSIPVVATGPHVMKDYAGCVNALVYGTSKNYRVSWNATGSISKIYRRDVPAVFTNDGSDISWIYELNETGLGSDEFLKIITRVYMRCKILKQEAVTITIPSYDSSSDGQGLDYTGTGLQTVSETLTMPYTGSAEIYRLFQKVFSSRYRGAIFKPKFTGSTNLDFRIISVSILSELKRRRML